MLPNVDVCNLTFRIRKNGEEEIHKIENMELVAINRRDQGIFSFHLRKIPGDTEWYCTYPVNPDNMIDADKLEPDTIEFKAKPNG